MTSAFQRIPTERGILFVAMSLSMIGSASASPDSGAGCSTVTECVDVEQRITGDPLGGDVPVAHQHVAVERRKRGLPLLTQRPQYLDRVIVVRVQYDERVGADEVRRGKHGVSGA